MIKKFSGICDVHHNLNVRGYIEYKDSSTMEGDEYSKAGVDCNYKEIYKCRRNDCPFWIKAQKVIQC